MKLIAFLVALLLGALLVALLLVPVCAYPHTPRFREADTVLLSTGSAVYTWAAVPRPEMRVTLISEGTAGYMNGHATFFYTVVDEQDEVLENVAEEYLRWP